jgi:hypothetical protein
MSASLLQQQGHLPIKMGKSLATSSLMDGKNLEDYLEGLGQPGLSQRHPLLLLGADRGVFILQHQLGSDYEWSLPIQHGTLKGAEAVWAANLGAGGTPAATLKDGASSTAALAWVDDRQLSTLRASAGSECQLVALSKYKFVCEKETVTELTALLPGRGILLVDGQPRAVASSSQPGGSRPMLMIEVADWLCEKAQRAGISIQSAQQLQQVSQDPIILQQLLSLMQPSMDSKLKYKAL